MSVVVVVRFVDVEPYWLAVIDRVTQFLFRGGCEHVDSQPTSSSSSSTKPILLLCCREVKHANRIGSRWFSVRPSHEDVDVMRPRFVLNQTQPFLYIYPHKLHIEFYLSLTHTYIVKQDSQTHTREKQTLWERDPRTPTPKKRITQNNYSVAPFFRGLCFYGQLIAGRYLFNNISALA